MVVGKKFAWGHMRKTGGDATHTLFRQVPDLIEWAHETEDPRKHWSFKKVGVTGKEKLLLNLRRLPSLVLSHVHHVYDHGLGDLPVGTILTAEDASRFRHPERMIIDHTDDGRLPIRWLRRESLCEDFLRFVSELRPVSEPERDAILGVTTEASGKHELDPLHFFSPEQVQTLYHHNPTWARYELEVYGEIPVHVPTR